MKSWKALWFVAVAIFVLPLVTLAQDAGHPDPEVIEGLYPGKAYSPYAQRSFPSRVYWGETHLHTGIPEAAELIGQERAYTSPIWYTP